MGRSSISLNTSMMDSDSMFEPWADVLGGLRRSAEYGLWHSAARRATEDPSVLLAGKRNATVTILATHTVDFIAELLPIAGSTVGVNLVVNRVGYGQLDAALLDPVSSTRTSPPDYVLLCGTAEDLELNSPDDAVESAVRRWTGMWRHVRSIGARAIQCLFAVPPHDVEGNQSNWLPSSASSLIGRINRELVQRGDDVLFVDCDRLAADFGRLRWRDHRYWDTVRQPIALEALPMLARTVAGVIANDMGLSRRCLVLDLDNTLWQGVIGEDGVHGVVVTDAFARFQQYVRGLRRRGMVLAVASNNDAALVARGLAEVYGMRLRPDDFATIVADWRPKSEQLLDIADRLNIGLDSVAFVDDNPAQCAQVAARLPDVDVIVLPRQAARYVAALSGRPTLELGVPDVAVARDRAVSYHGIR